MIPRALPNLIKTALTNGWDVHVKHEHAGIEARFARGHTLVSLTWCDRDGTPRLDLSTIDHIPTAYKHCAALLRSTERTTS